MANWPGGELAGFPVVVLVAIAAAAAAAAGENTCCITSFVPLSVRPSVLSSVRPSVPSVLPSVRPSFLPSLRPSVLPSVCPLARSRARLVVRSFATRAGTVRIGPRPAVPPPPLEAQIPITHSPWRQTPPKPYGLFVENLKLFHVISISFDFDTS